MRRCRLRLWDLTKATPALDWLLPTKRPENINRITPCPPWPENASAGTTVPAAWRGTRRAGGGRRGGACIGGGRRGASRRWGVVRTGRGRVTRFSGVYVNLGLAGAGTPPRHP